MRLIDADKLKEKWTIASPEPYNTDATEVLSSIDVQPTIEAVPVVYGEWIKDSCPEEPEGFSYYKNYKCSKCKSWVRRRYNFCPNCGAVMRKGGANQ